MTEKLSFYFFSIKLGILGQNLSPD